MKIKILIEDAEYRDALVQAISNSDRSVFAEVSNTIEIGRNSILVTDNPVVTDYDAEDVKDCAIVYISESREDVNMLPPGPYVLFKYSDMKQMIQELILCYYMTCGGNPRNTGTAGVIGVCSDGNNLESTEFCRNWARNLAYISGETVLLVSLASINWYGTEDGDEAGLHKLCYFVQSASGVDADVLLAIDNYDVRYIPARLGANKLIEFRDEDLCEFLDSLAGLCDYLVLDVGDHFTRVNRIILSGCEEVYYVARTEPTECIAMLLNGSDASGSRVRHIPPGRSINLRMTEYVEEYLRRRN